MKSENCNNCKYENKPSTHPNCVKCIEGFEDGYEPKTSIDFNSYDYIIIAFSGGKDSTACVLDLLEQGAPKDKMMLWHHDIDGRGESDLMDWPVTRDYCKKFAVAVDIPIYFSWKNGGFEKEMLRENAPTAPVSFEALDGSIITTGGERSKPNTRRKFPQVSADLRVRWCTAYLKIDVGCRAITKQEAFINKRTLFVTGERAQESACRAKYKKYEPHATDNRNGKRIKRHVDHYRPVHSWSEQQVWNIIKRWNIKPHPCYYLGWGRCSCAACIFGSKDQWASLNKIAPRQTNRIINYEKEFNVTINRTKSVTQQIEAGTPYKNADPESKEGKQVLSKDYTDNIIVENWELPSGAYTDSCGPS